MSRIHESGDVQTRAGASSGDGETTAIGTASPSARDYPSPASAPSCQIPETCAVEGCACVDTAAFLCHQCGEQGCPLDGEFDGSPFPQVGPPE